jgi:eukaryotic-like serine/threonine-protein kinase
MNTKRRIIIICFLAISLWVVGITISSCVPGQLFAPKLAPTPTLGIGSTKVSPMDGMILLYVPEGDFLMGSTDSETDATDQEKPQHMVHLDAFWIDQTEVTSAMYAKCVASGKCKLPWCLTGSEFDKYPAVCVDWFNAKAYCEWAGRRLPTEAEWEKAARGTDSRLYPWGNEPATCEYAVMKNDSGYGCGEGLARVGSRPKGASLYGALDMAGNVFEWVNDWYDAYYYSTSPSSNPTGPASGSEPVLRGGFFGNNARFLRVAYRVPHSNNPTGGESGIGFRCSASPEP